MYNLIVGATGGSIHRSRMLEFTSEDATQFAESSPRYQRLLTLPTLLMPELNDTSEPPYARVGKIDEITLESGTTVAFRFRANDAVAAIQSDRIAELTSELGVDSWELDRTHWAVKNVDLYDAVLTRESGPGSESAALSIPTHLARERDLVAVMMPFAGFDHVYDAIRSAAADAGLRCLRADDIWESHNIMDDVLSLIWRAQIVVSDLTGKNSNVFYETGIAHTLGRHVVPLARTLADVPFDLQSIRTLEYLPNTEGLEALRSALTRRLRTLAMSG
ncbi:hypothetical protein [Microbacterium sp. TPD7012]|uniref:hypothetical protein n=1 Tax=Microbacterium sp. TPD7012 TaxID=2171975 RepID=UPI000D50DCCA|nr:hypothetical protein [Microbacterium sp. TPD7012]PVE94117.1 hypothetical protein DC434_15280 [Microbacterium sp. TPD7012]